MYFYPCRIAWNSSPKQHWIKVGTYNIASFSLKWKIYILSTCVLSLDILWPASWSFSYFSMSLYLAKPQVEFIVIFGGLCLSGPSILYLDSTASSCLSLPELQLPSPQLSQITRFRVSPSSFWKCYVFSHGFEVSFTETSHKGSWGDCRTHLICFPPPMISVLCCLLSKS